MNIKKILLFIPIFLLMVLIPLKTAELVIDSEIEKEKRIEGELQIDEPKEDSRVEEVKEDTSSNSGNTQTNNTSTNWWSYPKDIKVATRDGNDLLVLVNKEYKLPSTYAPSDLVKASTSGIRRGDSYYLRSVLISDLRDMVNAMSSEGIDISIVSGYRSYATQQSTYNYWLSKNNNNADYVDTFSARAGHSQHQLGTAIDFSSSEINDSLGDSFANTKASKWLVSNGYKYGFVISFPKGYESVTGYKYESWHYRYIGKSNAQEMVNSGNILENYLRGKN